MGRSVGRPVEGQIRALIGLPHSHREAPSVDLPIAPRPVGRAQLALEHLPDRAAREIVDEVVNVSGKPASVCPYA